MTVDRQVAAICSESWSSWVPPTMCPSHQPLPTEPSFSPKLPGRSWENCPSSRTCLTHSLMKRRLWCKVPCRMAAALQKRAQSRPCTEIPLSVKTDRTLLGWSSGSQAGDQSDALPVVHMSLQHPSIVRIPTIAEGVGVSLCSAMWSNAGCPVLLVPALLAGAEGG